MLNTIDKFQIDIIVDQKIGEIFTSAQSHFGTKGSEIDMLQLIEIESIKTKLANIIQQQISNS